MNQTLAQKRILYIITKSNFGGAQRYVLELALAMKERGYKTAVACGGQGELVTRLQKNTIDTYEIDGFQRDISFFKEIKSLRSLSKTIKQFRPDVVHLNSAKAGLLGVVVARLWRVPKIIFTVHGWPFLEERPWWWKLMAWAGSYLTSLLSHKIIVVNQHDINNSKMIGLKNKIKLIHTTVDNFTLVERNQARETLFSPEEIETHRHNIWLVTIAELNSNKNHTTAIDAVAEFNTTHSSKIFYTLIGEGETAQNLKNQVELRGLKDYVCFLGYKKEARKYLYAFDIFLLPSKKEGLPYALLEAGHAKLPCIASAVGGISEVITNNTSGILTNPNNHDTIVKALDILINNPDKRSLYSTNLNLHIDNNFNLDTMIKKTEKIYQT